ncbi:MAG: GtrA family protein [Bacteroidetes bacterium]|nr:GtrA family protein [Bacteroidota bacterium]
MRQRIISFIDFFYPPFSKLMPEQTFRYAVCGGTNMFVDIFTFFISYNFILHKQILDLGFIVFKPHIAAFFMSFCISFPIGFLLMRNIVFTESTLHGRVQLFRYFLLVIVCILLNYFFIKFFVEQLHIFPTLAKLLTTVIVVFFSYLTQKYFTFKVEEVKAD